MDNVYLYTKNCIVTGEVANCWTGHVVANFDLAEDSNGRVVHTGTKLHIIAGFKDNETLNRFLDSRSNYNPCYGDYKEFMGVESHL